jgi:hypothetical protein
MVHSSSERPTRPTTQTSVRADRKWRRRAWNLQRISAKTAHPDGLDWDQFRNLYRPDSRRHDFEAIVAYGDYRHASRPLGGSETASRKAAAADAGSLGECDGEGRASRDPSRGGRGR